MVARRYGMSRLLWVTGIVLLFAIACLEYENIMKIDFNGSSFSWKNSGMKNNGCIDSGKKSVVQQQQSHLSQRRNETSCWVGDNFQSTVTRIQLQHRARELENRYCRLTCHDDDDDPCSDWNTSPSFPSQDLTIAVSYYSHPAMLLYQLNVFSSYPESLRSRLKIIIIDDGSPEGLWAEDYLRSGGGHVVNGGNDSDSNSNNNSHDNIIPYESLLDLKLVRIDQDIVYNMAGAKNLACHLSETSQILLLDLDLIIPQKAMEQCLELNTTTMIDDDDKRGRRQRQRRLFVNHKFYRNTEKFHPGVTLVDVCAYFAAGGCDEDYSGSYGHEDTDFEYRWSQIDPTQRKTIYQKDIVFVHPKDAPKRCSADLILSDRLVDQCRTAEKRFQPAIKDPALNQIKLDTKVQSGIWSNIFLRFPWHEVFHRRLPTKDTTT
ncbi:hypothetical protein IV203_025442 [Nitzschia inconspicua]|uniref:Uncharacterized protein n=1 Tax=Nitzschia inconspicua TaxID=303405 RepID=A0A9K3PA06_9STRA|nr:hypothetical protein IV203_028223 [Nitzschia inconspicua]KAG7362558.1 hypothetical protein IV203_025442 [Nitzschia inconspicua]